MISATGADYLIDDAGDGRSQTTTAAWPDNRPAPPRHKQHSVSGRHRASRLLFARMTSASSCRADKIRLPAVAAGPRLASVD